MNRLTQILLATVALITTAEAHASVLSTTVMAGGFLLSAVLAVVAVLYHRRAKDSANRATDLEQRLHNSEKTVAQLQVIRGEMTEQLNMAKAETVTADQRRRETSDMLVALRSQVERVARVDGLTGVANRQQFDISISDEIKRCVRERKDMALILVEIDSFVDFRDINGQQRAEFTLQRVAQSISDSFRRAGDLVARIGESKFAVLLPGTDGANATRFAEKMRRTIYAQALPFPASEVADRVTVSVGLATLPPVRLHKAENAIAMAESALRSAQNNGCNQVSVSETAAA